MLKPVWRVLEIRSKLLKRAYRAFHVFGGTWVNRNFAGRFGRINVVHDECTGFAPRAFQQVVGCGYDPPASVRRANPHVKMILARHQDADAREGALNRFTIPVVYVDFDPFR